MRNILSRKKKAAVKFNRHESRWFYIMISPWLIGFAVFTAYPMLSSLYYSFTDWNMFEKANFLGILNYAKLLRDDMFWKALGNTFYYAFIFVTLNMIMSIIVAVMLNRDIRGKRIFRTIFYLPTLVPVVVTALLFFRILAPEGGLVNTVLAYFGITGPQWFFDELWAKPALIIMALWGLGTSFILLLSGMQSIPTELYEAARIEGSSAWVELRKITLPMLSPVIFYNLVMGIISGLQIFTQVYVIGSNELMPGGSYGNGGGPGNSLLTIVQLLYLKAFREYKMGYASAIAWVLFLITLVLTLLVFRSSALWVYYEEERK